ncbi:Ig-like domain repeat protein [Aeromicrobium chenweiae]|nr:Ig-like domain repeat protein [Aeromicrobium chenweiae]
MIDPTGRYTTTTVPYAEVITMQHSPDLRPVDLGDEPLAEFSARASRGARPPTSFLLYRADDGGTQAPVTFLEGADQQHTLPGPYKVRTGNATWLGGRSFDSAKTITLKVDKATSVTFPSDPTNGDLAGRVVGEDGVLMKDGVATVYAADNEREIIATAPVNELFLAIDLPVRPYKIRISDPTGRYATRWVGGAETFAKARAFTPEISEQTNLGTVAVPRRSDPPRKVAALVSFKLSSSSVRPRRTVSATVQVFAKGVARPTGKIVIKKGSVTLKTITLRASDRGRRTFRTPKLPRGKHTLRAVYSGDATVLGRSSVTRTLRVR